MTRVIGVGLVGLGRATSLSWPALSGDPRLWVVAGCDPDAHARETFGTATGIATVATLDALLAIREIDAVYVATPVASHAPVAIAAARAGKHVLVEKPMALDLAQAEAMCAAAQASATVLLIGPSHGYDPPVALAARLVTSGDYGPARFIEARAFTDFVYRARPLADLQRLSGGGAVFGQACHMVDSVRRIAGRQVRRVSGWTGDWDAARPTDGAFGALLRFDDGLCATLTYSGYARYDLDAARDWPGEMGAPRPTAGFGSTRAGLRHAVPRGFAPDFRAPEGHERLGAMLVCCERAELEIVPLGVIVHDGTASTLHPVPLPRFGRQPVIDAFVTAIRGGASSLFDGSWGRETLACCIALLRSARLGEEVSVHSERPST